MRPLLVALSLTCAIAHAQLSLEPDALGSVPTITDGGTLVAEGMHLRIVKPGWEGTLGIQDPTGGLTVEKTEQDGAVLFSGQFSCEGNPCEFSQRVERDGEGWRVTYAITPTADLQTEQVFVMLQLPTEGNAGQARYFFSEADAIFARAFPEQLPDPYHLTGSGASPWIAWILPDGRGLRMAPDGAGIKGFALQDNRQFNINAFQVQFGVSGTKGLTAGKTYTFGLNLQPFSQALLAQEEQKLVDLSLPLVVEMTSDEPLALAGVRMSNQTVPRFGKLELVLDLAATFDNPFDPEDIDVTATFTGPRGQSMTVPGFFYQDYELIEHGDRTSVTRQGDPDWRVRFAPPEAGSWKVSVSVRDRSGTVNCEPVSFECTPSDDPGFIRRVPDNPYYMQFDDGTPYFAVGENICWSGAGRVHQYEDWFSSLGNAGGNYCRIWLVRWNMALEWTNEGSREGVYYGLGKYSLDNASRLDWVLEKARENGIYCMLALGYHGELADQEDYFKTNCWQWNPYNKANGGPCEKPADFWTDEQARKLYKQRLRYMVARYGWDSAVLSWEFWNEVIAPAPWVDEMARYFAASDPFDHLVTTTYGYDEVWRVPELDYTQAHTYGSDDTRHSTVPHIASLGTEYTTNWRKPFMVGEFGIDWKRSDSYHDPNGIGTSLHNGMWASVMTRSFGTAAIWYWDGYVHPKNLYPEFTSIRAFVDAVPWGECRFEFIQADPLRTPANADAPWSDVSVQPLLGWGPSNHTDYEIGADGTVEHNADFAATLFSESKKDMKRPLRFHVTYPREGKLIFRVASVSAGADLHIRVDDDEVYRKEFAAGPGEGEWQETRFYDEWGIWQSRYDKDYEVTIPAGRHVIELENTGADWISIARYTFSGCKDPAFADIDLMGLFTDDRVIAWFHDRESTWYNDREGKTPGQIAGANSVMRGLADGTYSVDWWDTRTGKVILTQTAECREGNLPVTAPAFTRDIAVHMKKVGGE